MISVRQATGFINTLSRHSEVLGELFSQGDSLDEKAKKVIDYVSRTSNGSTSADQLRKLPECAWANLLVCHAATNTGTELATLSSAINGFIETRSDINDVNEISVAELKKHLLQEAANNKLGNISVTRLNEIGDEAITNLVSFSRPFQKKAFKYTQEGNTTIYKNVELTSEESSALVLKDADQNKLTVSNDEIERLNKAYQEKGLGFKVAEGDKLVVVSVLPTDKPFHVDVNATNSETSTPAIFRIMIDKITGNPPTAAQLASAAVTNSKLGIGLMIGGIIGAIGSFFADKFSDGNTKLASGLAIIGTIVAGIGTYLTFEKKISTSTYLTFGKKISTST